MLPFPDGGGTIDDVGTSEAEVPVDVTGVTVGTCGLVVETVDVLVIGASVVLGEIVLVTMVLSWVSVTQTVLKIVLVRGLYVLVVALVVGARAIGSCRMGAGEGFEGRSRIIVGVRRPEPASTGTSRASLSVSAYIPELALVGVAGDM